MKLGRSFFSLYVLLLLCFGALSFALDHVWQRSVKQDIASYSGYKTLLVLLADSLQQADPATWSPAIDDTARQYNLPLSLQWTQNSADNTSTDVDITSPQVLVTQDGDWLTFSLALSEQSAILILGPVKASTAPKTPLLLRVLMVLLLGILLYLWLRPISRDLARLDSAVAAFGSGNFNTQVVSGDSALIKPIIKTFNMMSSRIKHLLKAHRELTTAVSHELSTPLARSKFALQVLSSTSDADTQQRYIKSINTDICELESLVNDLVMYNSFDTTEPTISFELTDISAIVQEQVTNITQPDLTVNVNDSLDGQLVRCDPHFISRAISNVLNNAVTFGRGRIDVTLALTEQHCCITVDDNGSGVADEFKARVFDAFSRFDQSRGKDTGGFGLGLAIVSKVMRWHHGIATVDDSPLGGARFVLTWPVR
ncbi:ATP-binding protein [Thalassotalea ponticola]|uniref:ATP-binding protein n=1 Tax=Thalassotalea ponticola TaxID=1523392 RepID=UPI0025B5E97B|nr:ATP-binding protein [Thalassotalea ponticola]MDN3651243.1 ATP-binding protein [Thalassotalea ponticola]